MLTRNLERRPPLGEALAAHLQARGGMREEALSALEDLLDRWRRDETGAFPVAVVYAGLGDFDRAFEWLDRAIEDHSSRLEPGEPLIMQPLYEMDPDGNSVSALFAGSQALEPTWFPDGSRLAFSAGDGWWGGTLYSIHADGSDVRPLLPGGFEAGSPTFAPDGSRLAFVRAEELGMLLSLWTTNADGMNPTQMTLAHRSGPDRVVWSPDGHHLAFADREPLGGFNVAGRINLMNDDGSDVRTHLERTVSSTWPTDRSSA